MSDAVAISLAATAILFLIFPNTMNRAPWCCNHWQSLYHKGARITVHPVGQKVPRFYYGVVPDS